MELPYIQSEEQTLNLIQTKWRSILNPLLATPLTNGQLLTGIRIIPGTNQIAHRLGRKMLGWIVADIDFTSVIYRHPNYPLNDKFLYLNSDSICTISLWVF